MVAFWACLWVNIKMVIVIYMHISLMGIKLMHLAKRKKKRSRNDDWIMMSIGPRVNMR